MYSFSSHRTSPSFCLGADRSAMLTNAEKKKPMKKTCRLSWGVNWSSGREEDCNQDSVYLLLPFFLPPINPLFIRRRQFCPHTLVTALREKATPCTCDLHNTAFLIFNKILCVTESGRHEHCSLSSPPSSIKADLSRRQKYISTLHPHCFNQR